MQSKKEYFLESLLAGSALVLVNQDDMLTALTFNNLFSLVSIEGDDITFIMQNFEQDSNGDVSVGNKETVWTFNTEDIYLLKTFDDTIDKTIKTTFWLDKYPHKNVLKEIKNVNSFVNHEVLPFHDLENQLPPVMVENIVDTIKLVVNPENDDEVYDCDTNDDSDIFFLLEHYLLNKHGYLALTDTYIPIALD